MTYPARPNGQRQSDHAAKFESLCDDRGMSDITPGWRFVSIGFSSTPVSIQGIDLWKHEKKWVGTDESIVVAHPSYPAERHTMFVYTLQLKGQRIRFAMSEYSNGVWGFYEPV